MRQSSANSPDKWEKKYKWTDELTLSGHDPKSQDAACKNANEKVGELRLQGGTLPDASI
jgi:hypothetical protein